MEQKQYQSIRLKPGKDRSVRNYHPWIFSGAVATEIKSLQEGEIVEVFDAENKYLATGHFHKGTIMVRVLSFRQRMIDLEFWKQRFEEALQLRKTIGLPLHGKTTAFRLIHAEGDHLPGLVIDIYGNTAVVQAHSQGMQLSLDLITRALLSLDRKSTRLNSSHIPLSRMPSSA